MRNGEINGVTLSEWVEESQYIQEILGFAIKIYDRDLVELSLKVLIERGNHHAIRSAIKRSIEKGYLCYDNGCNLDTDLFYYLKSTLEKYDPHLLILKQDAKCRKFFKLESSEPNDADGLDNRLEAFIRGFSSSGRFRVRFRISENAPLKPIIYVNSIDIEYGAIQREDVLNVRWILDEAGIKDALPPFKCGDKENFYYCLGEEGEWTLLLGSTPFDPGSINLMVCFSRMGYSPC